MQLHVPTLLQGPRTKSRAWWPRSEEPFVGRQEDRPIRTELVERVRKEIADGDYETPEKWEKALDRLYRRLQRDQ